MRAVQIDEMFDFSEIVVLQICGASRYLDTLTPAPRPHAKEGLNLER